MKENLTPIPYHFELLKVFLWLCVRNYTVYNTIDTFILETTFYSVLPSRISKCPIATSTDETSGEWERGHFSVFLKSHFSG